MQRFYNIISRCLCPAGTSRKMRSEGKSAPKGFISGELRHVAMLNFEIEPEALSPHVPRCTELDSWQGKTFVSMVGSLFVRPRVFGFPLMLQRRFAKVDLRFYVRRETSKGTRRGVVFIKQMVPKQAIAAVGRCLHGEAFVALPMDYRVDLSELSGTSRGSIEYKWYHHGRWNGFHIEIKNGAGFSLQDSEEEFTMDRYWGYSALPDGSCLEYRIEHPKWRLWESSATAFTCEDPEAFGQDLGSCLIRSPSSAFVAEGSPVTLYGGNPLSG